MDEIKDFMTYDQGKLILTFGVLVLLYIIRFIAIKILDRIKGTIRRRYLRQQVTNYLVTIIGAVILSAIWYSAFRSVFTFLGLVMGALVIASKEMILNLAANVVIFWRGVFKVGDRIEIGEYIGDVVEAGPMFITLSEIGSDSSKGLSTGCMIKIPNMIILSSPVRNLSRGLPLIWNDIDIEITHNSNYNKAKQILEEIAGVHSYRLSDNDIEELKSYHEELMFYQKDPFVLTEIQGKSIKLSMNYICKFHDKRSSENSIYEEIIKKILSDPDIKLEG